MARKFVLAILSIAVVVGSCSSVGFAQAASKQMVAIPFKFVFEGITLPAGTYEVDLMDSGMLLLLNSRREPVAEEVSTLPLPPTDTAGNPELIFANSSDGYTLVEVHTAEERRLLTSHYGHPKFVAQQLRSVPITSVTEASTVSPKQAATQGR
jgi:hypothetical protein